MPAAASTSTSPPGVHVDKQTSLLLAPPSWGPAGSSGNGASPINTKSEESSPAAGSSQQQQQQQTPPRCHYEEEYLEEDMHSLLSDWMEYDTRGEDGENSDDGERDGATNYDVDPIAATTSPLSARRKKHVNRGSKKKWRKLQWRPPGMGSNNKNQKSTCSSKHTTPRLPPSSKSQRKRIPKKQSTNNVVIKSHPPTSSSSASSVAGAASVTTFRSNASTIFTRNSTATQQHSNRTKTTNNTMNGRQQQRAAYSSNQASILGSMASGASSVKSSTPPLARLRRRRKTALDDKLKAQRSSSTAMAPPVIEEASPLIDTTPSVIINGMMALDDSNSLAMGNGNENENVNNISAESDEQTHVTFENLKIKVTKNYTQHSSTISTTPSVVTPDKKHTTAWCDAAPSFDEANDGICGVVAPITTLDEAKHIIDTTYASGSAVLVDLGKAGAAAVAKAHVATINGTSPTSVMQGGGLPDCGAISGIIPFDEYHHYNNMNQVTDGLRRLTVNGAAVPVQGTATTTGPIIESDNNPANTGSTSFTWDGIKADDVNDEETVATIDKPRKPGPIDVDTCTRHLTSAERRNLRAMHTLGYAHLRNNELPQSLAIFTEIVRGQKERHGKRSLQAAMAMHNLGVVCMRSGRYMETTRLCDGAARIRVEKLGKDSLEVAMSLSQQGVALMELKEYCVALASFKEALRIRQKAWGSESHLLIVRLLNNIGCALFEMNELSESRLAFEKALIMQRVLMKGNNSSKMASLADDVEDENDNPFEIDPRQAYHTPLSIALTLTNLGSIHLRLNEFDKSLVYFEEAVLVSGNVVSLQSYQIYTFNFFRSYWSADTGICVGRGS